MGQVFQKHQNNFDPSIIVTLKPITMRSLFDCVDTIDKYYPQSCFLNYQEFDDIFATLSDNVQNLFNRLAEKNDGQLLVHTFEALAAFCVFSGESFEIKCMFVFRLFDFDLSNTLEEHEIINTLQCVVRAMCKIAGLVIPSVSMLEKLALVCFQMMDSDKNKHVDFDEFYDWSVHYDELQEFMLTYSGTQTYTYALKRMTQIMEQSEFQYHEWLLQSKQPMIPALHMRQYINTTYSLIDLNSREVLFYMIVEYTLRSKSIGSDEQSPDLKNLWAWKIDHKKSEHLLNDLYIKKSDFLDIIRAWNAYSITDVNNLSTVSIRELKLLLWLYEDEEPDFFKVNQEMNIIDTNQNKLIEREEWMRYLCSEDAMMRRQSPQALMKKVFDNYDEEQSGFVQVIYIDSLLRDTFKQQMKKLKDFKAISSVSNLITTLKADFQKEVKKNKMNHFDWGYYFKFLSEATHSYTTLNKLLNLNRD